MVKLILGAIAGFFGGAALTRRHKKRLETIEAGTKNSVAKKLVVDGRRSLLIAHTLVRMQLSRAFLSTARYPPLLCASSVPCLCSGYTLLMLQTCSTSLCWITHRSARGFAVCRRYAPVPLTFSNAILATYVPIMGTAVGVRDFTLSRSLHASMLQLLMLRSVPHPCAACPPCRLLVLQNLY